MSLDLTQAIILVDGKQVNVADLAKELEKAKGEQHEEVSDKR